MNLPFGFEDERLYRDFLIDLEKVLNYDCGKHVINVLFGACRVFDVNNNFQNNIQAFREGERNIGVQLLNAVMDIDGGGMYTKVLRNYWKRAHSERILNKLGGEND